MSEHRSCSKRRRICAAFVLSANLAQAFCPRLSVVKPTTTYLSVSKENEALSNTDENAVLHQQIKQADPDWYKEYVSNLLGEEYCADRWPEQELLDSQQVDDTATDEQEENEIEKDTTEEETEEEKEDEIKDGRKKTTVEFKDENSTPIESDSRTKNAESKTTETDTRAVVYRTIEGKKMTSVPLSMLLELGYTYDDLQRMQAEFLSIVVLDKRPCPSMGVPSQWKIQDPKATAELIFVDSIEEAKALCQQKNLKERETNDSIQKRRMRQEGRKSQSTKTRTTNSSKRQRRGERYEEKRNRQSNETPGERGIESDRNRQSRSQRERRRRRDSGPRKIYKVPRDDTRRRVARDDPPDPDSPLWVNMDTFRDLLEKEKDLRLKFVGNDWSEVIEQENDWREDLYKGWLWSLNNGVGESIVPPSRYERARRQRSRRPPPPPPSRRGKRNDVRSKRRRRAPPGDDK